MAKGQDYEFYNLLLSIIGGLIFFLQLAISFIISGIKKSIDGLWEKVNKTSDDLSRLQGEHEAICRRKHDDS